jgi:hypothetical protein
MNARMKSTTISLNHAVLCLDCNSISNANRECPACTSHALLNLSAVLNRPATAATTFHQFAAAA